ncbi:unnamed protein product [Psylliodes chrysocephalus]|uniref:C2H2-type domain-containing protein n=1 Tax=Psylliodes chrysocephalus TaxID=3402493 RepID=A0A9P0D9I0_9CUCU|nr:unnamed protein product [Psylliodes chrysocephala]
MKCFICKKIFFHFNVLIKHQKLWHGLTNESTFECCDLLCSQKFKNLKSFKRHFLNKHEQNSLLNSSTNIQEAADTVSATINKHEFASTSTNKSTKCKPLEIFNLSSTEFFPNSPCINTDKTKIDSQKTIVEFQKCCIQFSLDLHNKNNFSRKDVQKILSNIDNNIIEPLINNLKQILESRIENQELKLELFPIFKQFAELFKFCSTEYRLEQWLINKDYLSNLKHFQIHKDIVETYVDGEVSFQEIEIAGTLFSLKFQFRKIMQKNNNLEKNLMDLGQNVINNRLTKFVEGELWQQKIQMFNKNQVIPFFIYLDDMEINNPLGANASLYSVTAIYFSFPNFENCSKLQNIFLAGFVKAKDMKTFGNSATFKTLIQEISDLEKNGIEFQIEGCKRIVKFSLALILGDNLGQNYVLDFSKSFNSNFYCRFCKEAKSSCQSLTSENIASLRTKENYKQDTEKNDEKTTGIVQYSPFNDIPSFHVTDNFAVDIMHDIFEGVCHYDICQIIIYYITDLKLFTLDTLNIRKNTCNYGPIEIGNMSPPITMEHLTKRRLKMSARQMMTFVHFFSFIIGDLIPKDDEVWNFFLCLLKIIDILLSKEISKSEISLLAVLIEEHNQNYIRLFNDTLKPKFHFLLHYPTVIKKSGPPRNYWCFRFEAKHREFKLYAHAITSRKNICHSLTKKYQFKFAHFLLNNNSESPLEVEKKHKIESKYISNVNSISITDIGDFECYRIISYKGTIYKQGYYLTTFEDDTFQLYEILEFFIGKSSNETIYLVCKQVTVIGYMSHYDAYEVNKENCDFFDIQFKKIDCFSSYPINICRNPNGTTLVRPKEYLHLF